MTAVWYCVRAELRERLWARLTVVALIAITGGVVLTTAAGARRTSTAFSRLVRASNAAEVMAKAEEAYASAREWSQDRIEVAVAD